MPSFIERALDGNLRALQTCIDRVHIVLSTATHAVAAWRSASSELNEQMRLLSEAVDAIHDPVKLEMYDTNLFYCKECARERGMQPSKEVVDGVSCSFCRTLTACHVARRLE